MRIDRSGMCCRKPIKLGFYIKFMNFLMMNMRLIKCEHISLRIYMYCKHWCSCQDRINGENLHQSLASIVRNACWVLYFESDTKIQKIPSKKLSKKGWTTGGQCESRSSLAESTILKYVGLGATADPAGSNSIWRMCQSTRLPLIVISSECTNLYHSIFLF